MLTPARVAMDLGHGDGRDELVKQVYVQHAAGGKSRSQPGESPRRDASPDAGVFAVRRR